MLELHYILRPHPTHPYTAVIVGPTYIGSEVQFRDENQMRCYAMGFLHAWERDRITQVEIKLYSRDLPTNWDRQKLAFGEAS